MDFVKIYLSTLKHTAYFLFHRSNAVNIVGKAADVVPTIFASCSGVDNTAVACKFYSFDQFSFTMDSNFWKIHHKGTKNRVYRVFISFSSSSSEHKVFRQFNFLIN